MDIIRIGEGDPEAFVVGSIHGDEPCGKNAIRRILDENLYPDNLNICFIIANERALSEKKRYIDCDMNRAFPGDKDSDKHEENTAARITENLNRKAPILSIHSSVSTDKSFAVVFNLSESLKRVSSYIDVNNIVINKKFHYGSLSSVFKDNCIEIECGMKGTEKTTQKAVEETINFLQGVKGENKIVYSYDIYELYEMVQGKNFEFLKENFSVVKKGETFARKGDEKIVAEEDFYPVLMSDNGYDEKIGFKSRKVDFPKMNKFFSKRSNINI